MARRAKARRGGAPKPRRLFDLRWERALRDLRAPLARLYGPDRLDDLVARVHDVARKRWRARPDDLRALDTLRDVDPEWFLHERMAGYVLYVDRFCGTLKNLPARIPYLRDLGVTYLHLMPCLQPRPGPNDGGYAVMDYGAIDPRLGTMDDLEEAARALRRAGISLCLDMVLNHTAREHAWAERARAGDAFHEAFYRTYPTEDVPRAFERTLPEVFPDQAPGSFTFDPDLGKWVWTTFNDYQWDLSWENPEVFLAILDAMLALANRGVEAFRLDAVAFLWKRLGTTCQNLPEVHDVVQALVAAVRAAAPAVIHKAEAIVGPQDLVPYLGEGRHEGRVSQLAYHNSLMVQAWSALASADTRLMTHVLRGFPESHRRAAFATYLRCHDDIGWAITPEDASAIPHMDDRAHRAFLADFYAGAFPGSWSRGADFQANPATGDRRTVGSLASLAGLESALEAGDPALIDAAVQRILLGHALVASYAGLPLLYMGDEVGMLNDWSFRAAPDLADDARWVHRPFMDWSAPEGPAARIRDGVRAILAARARTPALAGRVPTRVLDAGPALFAFARLDEVAPVTGLFNVTNAPARASLVALGLDAPLRDLLADAPVAVEDGHVTLPPYAALWLGST